MWWPGQRGWWKAEVDAGEAGGDAGRRCLAACVPVPGTTFPATSQSLAQWCHVADPRLAHPGPLGGARGLGRQRGTARMGGFVRAASAGSTLTKHLGSIKLLWSPLHIYQMLTTFVFLAAAGAASLETRGFTSLFPFPNSFDDFFFWFCRFPSNPQLGQERWGALHRLRGLVTSTGFKNSPVVRSQGKARLSGSRSSAP